jgi:hypothetical protein
MNNEVIIARNDQDMKQQKGEGRAGDGGWGPQKRVCKKM